MISNCVKKSFVDCSYCAIVYKASFYLLYPPSKVQWSMVFFTSASFGNGEGNYLSQVCLPLANRNHFEKQQWKQEAFNKQKKPVMWSGSWRPTNEQKKTENFRFFFFSLKKEKLFPKFSSRHDKKGDKHMFRHLLPKVVLILFVKGFSNHKCHIQLEAKRILIQSLFGRLDFSWLMKSK